jgi:hypothetical protein
MTGSVLNKKKIQKPYMFEQKINQRAHAFPLYKFIPLHSANSGTILQRIIRRRKNVVTSHNKTSHGCPEKTYLANSS